MAKEDGVTRDIRSRLRTAVGAAPRYAKGTAKLFLASGTEYFNVQMPAVGGMIEVNKDLLQDAVRFLRNPVDAINKQVDRAMGTDSFKELQRFAKNALDDLKTGNLYDPNRDRSEIGMQIDDMLSEFGGFDMTGFDENGDWSGDETTDPSVEADIKIAEVQEENASKRTAATIDAIGASTSAIVNTQNANSQTSLRMSMKQHSQHMNAMQNMITSQNATFELINKSITAQLDITREAHNQIMGEFTEIKSLLTEIRDGVLPKQDKKEYRAQDEVFGVNGELNIKNYVKSVMKNIDDYYGIRSNVSMMTGGMDLKTMLQTVSDNPLQLITDVLVANLVPKNVKRQMTNTNKNLGSFFPAMLQKLGQRGKRFESGESNSILDMLAGFFGVTPRSRTSIDTEQENPLRTVPFTAKTSRAIEEVIPMWLSKIYSAVSGSPLMVYNYTTGKLEKASKVISASEHDARDLVGRMGESGYETIQRAGMYNFRTSKEKEDFQKYVYQYLQKQGEDGAFINPFVSKEQFKSTMPSSMNQDLYYSLLQGILQSMPRDKLMQMSRDIIDARNSRDRNNQDLNQSLKDSGLIAAWSGFLDPDLRDKLSSRTMEERSGLSESQIDNLSKEHQDQLRKNGGVAATNVILNEILGTLKKGIITYTYNVGSAMPDTDINSIFKSVSDSAIDQREAEMNLINKIKEDEKRRKDILEAEKKRSAEIMADPTRPLEKMYVTEGYDAESAKKFQRLMEVSRTSAGESNNPEVEQERLIRDMQDKHRGLLASQTENLRGNMSQVVKKTGIAKVFETLKTMSEEPFRLFESGMQLMDAFMFKALFGEDAANGLEINGEPYLLQVLTKSLHTHFKNATDWFAKNVGDPLKKYLLDDDVGILPRVGRKLGEIFDIDGKKQRIKDKFGEVKTRFLGEREIGPDGKKGKWIGGKFSDQLNRFGLAGENIEGNLEGSINRILYGDYANSSRKGVGTAAWAVDEAGNVVPGSGEKQYGGIIGKFRKGFDSFNEYMFGPEGERTDSKKKFSKVTRELNKAFPDMAIGAGAGILASFLLPGGPLLGAMVGSATGLIKGSDKLQTFLFGEQDEEVVKDRNGNPVIDPKTGQPKMKKTRKGALISQEIYEGFSKYAPAVTKGALAGALAGGLGLLPFGMGTMAGTVLGSIGGMSAASDQIKTLIFGDGVDEKSGLISKEFRGKVVDQVKKYAPGAAGGALIGKMLGDGLGLIPGLSLLPTGPIFSLMGSMVGVANSDKLNKFFFGEEVESETTEIVDGKEVKKKKKTREGGMFGKVYDFTRDKLLTPVAKKFDETGKRISGWFQESIIGPLSRTVEPLREQITKAGGQIFDAFKHMGEHITESLFKVFNVNVGEPLGDFFKDKVLKPLDNMANKMFDAIGKVIGSIISAPFKALEFIVTGSMGGKSQDDIDREEKKESRWKRHRDKRHAASQRRQKKSWDRSKGFLWNLTHRFDEEYPDTTGTGSGSINAISGPVSNITDTQRASNDALKQRLVNKKDSTQSETYNGFDITSMNKYQRESFIKWMQDTGGGSPEDYKKYLAKQRRHRKQGSSQAAIPASTSDNTSQESNEEINRKKNTKFTAKTNNEHLADISKYTKKTYEEIKGQVNGMGWNTAYIKTLLEKQYGGLSDDELPDEMEGSKKKIRKRRTIFGKAFDKVSDLFGSAKDKVTGVFGRAKDKLTGILGIIVKPFQLIAQGAEFAKNALVGFGHGILEILKTIGSMAKEILIGAAKGLGKALSGVGGMIKAAGKGIGEALGNIAGTLTGVLHDLTLSISAGARGLFEIAADIAPDIAHGVWKGMKFLGKNAAKGLGFAAKGVAKGTKKGLSWMFGKITGKGSSPDGDSIKEKIKNIGKFTLDGGYLDKVNDSGVIKIGDALTPMSFPWVRVYRGVSSTKETVAIPVYILGVDRHAKMSTVRPQAEAPKANDSTNVDDFVNAYQRADSAAERANNPAEAYDRAMRSAKSKDEIQAISLAAQMNVNNGQLATVTTKEKSEDSNWLMDLLGLGTGGKGGVVSNLLSKFGTMFAGSKVGKFLSKGKGVLGGIGSFLKTATKGMLPLALGTMVGTATGTEDRKVTGGIKMASLPIFNLLTDGTKTKGGATGMVKATFGALGDKVKSLFGIAPKNAAGAADAAGDLVGSMGKIGWNQKITNALHNLGLKLNPGAINKATGHTFMDAALGSADEAANAAAKTGILGKIGSKIGETVKGFGTKAWDGIKSATSAIGSKVGSIGSSALDAAKNSNGLVGTITNKICDMAQQALNHNLVKKLIPKNVAGSVGKVVTEFKKKLGTALANVTSEGLEQFAKKLGIIVTIVTTAYDIVSGYNEAANILKIDSSSLTVGMRLAAGISKGLSGLAFGLIPVSWLTEMVYKLFANADAEDELDTAQANFKQAALSAGMTVAEYNRQQNKTTWQSITDTATAAKDAVVSGVSTAADAVVTGAKNFGSWVSNGWNKFWGGNGHGWGTGPMKQYSQTDKKWNKVDGSMANTGCGPTAAAMVATAYGKKADPLDANSMSYATGMRAPDGSTNPDFFSGYAASKGYGMRRGPTSSGMIASNLNKGRPVVLMGKGGAFGPDMHYIVANKIAGRGRVGFVDPWTGASRTTTMGSLMSNTASTIYSYGKGPASAPHSADESAPTSIDSMSTTEAQKALVDKMYWLSRNPVSYSLTGPQDPDKGSASCASTVGWAYRKVLGVDGMSAGSATQSTDPRFTTIMKFAEPGQQGNQTFDVNQLMPGDIVYMFNTWKRKDGTIGSSNHTEMYVGNGKDLSHGGPDAGPQERTLDATRQKRVFAVRRYTPFLNGSEVPIYDTSNSSGSSGFSLTDTTGMASGAALLTKFGDVFNAAGTAYDRFLNPFLGSATDDTEGTNTENGSINPASYTSNAASTAKGNTNTERIWNFLKSQGMTNYAIAGIMGNLYNESGMLTNNLQNSYNTKFNMTDDEYTQSVNSGSYKNFVKDSAGYGLAQWTYDSRKQALLDLVKSRNTSISDLPTQLDLLWKEMNDYGLIDEMNKSNSVRDASTTFLQQFEKPASMYESSTINKRATDAQSFYDEYGAGPGWGMGPSTNLLNLNDRIRSINTRIRKIQADAEEGTTVSQITNKITEAVRDHSSGGTSGDSEVLNVLTKSLTTMIELLSAIKENTNHSDDDKEESKPKGSKIPTVRGDNFGSSMNSANDQVDVGSRIVDALTSK